MPPSSHAAGQFTNWSTHFRGGSVEDSLHRRCRRHRSHEAAQVDGCTRAAAFRRVTFPLLAPGLLATSLFGFITAWNEFAFANMLIIKNQEDRTLPVWLSLFSNVFGTDWGATMAASTLFALPVLVLFLVLQRRVSAGMTGGAVKG
jgi:N,N'-diacetylchitobiose transport system permease protein